MVAALPTPTRTTIQTGLMPNVHYSIAFASDNCTATGLTTTPTRTAAHTTITAAARLPIWLPAVVAAAAAVRNRQESFGNPS